MVLLLIGALSGGALFTAGFTLGQRDTAPRQVVDPALVPVVDAYRRITSQYVGDVAPERLAEGAIRGMFEALGDPYSSYMTRQQYEDGLAGISGEFEGIGAEMTALTADGEACEQAGPDCQVRVVRVLEDSPALQSGLLEGDVLREVDGEPVEGRDLGSIVRRVRGPRGTEVTLTLLRGAEELRLTIVRDVIRTQGVRSELLAGGQVVYLRVEGMDPRTAEGLSEVLATHVGSGLERVVLDLRDDPGGFVDAAVAIASQFVASGPIYWEEQADGRRRRVDALAGGVATDPRIKVVVLVNTGTASASEIVAGALQDNGRAIVVGETTFGKGSIQQWQLLPEGGGGIRISVARWLTPDLSSIDGQGIRPDVVVEQAGQVRGGEQDSQLQEALRLLADGDEQTGGRLGRLAA